MISNRPFRWSAAAAIVLAACAPTVNQQTSMMRATGATRMSARELQSRVAALGRHGAEILEKVADSIRVASPDSVVRRNALRLKLGGVRAIREASLYPEPLVAYMDLAALVVQGRQFAEGPPGAAALGAEGAALLGARFAHLDRDVRKEGDLLGVTGGGSDFFARLEAWADRNPLIGPAFVREPITAEVADVFPEHQSLGQALGELEDAAYRLESRLAFLEAYAVKEAFWDLELAASVSDLFGPLHRADALMKRSALLIDSFPGLIRSEREIALRAITGERVATLEEVERQREHTLGEIREYLNLLLAKASGERALVLEAVQAERAIILEVLQAERAIILAQTDSLSQRLVDGSRDVVDHLFLRLAQFVGVGFVLVMLMRFLASRSRDRPQTAAGG